MMRSTDEAIIRKCMRLFIVIASTGVSLNSSISSNELQQFKEEKKYLLSPKGEKLLQKL